MNRFVAALNGSGVFDSAGIRRYEAVGAGVRVEFEVEGTVVRPFGVARDLPNYSGSRTVANRIYGLDGDAEDAAAQVADASSSDPKAPDDVAADETDEQEAGQRAPTFDGGEKRAAGRSQEDIPEALTDEQIAAMTQQEAFAQYVKRRSMSRTRTDLTQEVKDRLLDEAEKCRARAEEAKSEGGSAS